jgi:hypothetical protein
LNKVTEDEILFHAIDKKEKNDVRIIINSRLDSLIEVEAPVIKGVRTALVRSGEVLSCQMFCDAASL